MASRWIPGCRMPEWMEAAARPRDTGSLRSLHRATCHTISMDLWVRDARSNEGSSTVQESRVVENLYSFPIAVRSQRIYESQIPGSMMVIARPKDGRALRDAVSPVPPSDLNESVAFDALVIWGRSTANRCQALEGRSFLSFYEGGEGRAIFRVSCASFSSS